MAWDPAQYLRFGSERLRPALDLLARVSLDTPAEVIDLGCGAGNVTQVLRARWPRSSIVGVDSSPEMLQQARIAEPSARWIEADIGAWRPAGPVDLIFSNAALHWLPDHAGLLSHLFGYLKPGGVLAVQMPNQTGAPSHRGIGDGIDAALLPEDQKARLRALQVAALAAPTQYYDWASIHADLIDQWETLYTHVLGPAPPGASAVAEWTRSTSLKPVLEALDPVARERFWRDYCERMDGAYPVRADGNTLFAFRRFFMVARRRL